MSRSFKVVMLLSNPFRPDVRVLKEARSLAKFGYDVTIIAWDRQSELAAYEALQSGVKIIRIQHVRSDYGIGTSQLIRLPSFWRAAIRLLNQLDPQIVHCHDFDTLPAGLLWGKSKKHPVIYDAHEHYAELIRPRLRGIWGRLFYRILQTSERLAARFVSSVITVDNNLGSIYRKINKKVVIIGHYPSKEIVSGPNEVFAGSNLTMVYLGRMSIDRGLLVCSDVLRLLIDQGIPARLRLVGSFTPAHEEDVFLEHSKGLEHCIERLGNVPYQEVPSLLGSSDVGLALWQPEERYRLAVPIKVFEYMACGLPILGSNFELISEIVNTAKSGTLVDPTLTVECAAEISKWWNARERPREMGRNGQKAIMRTYNWETLEEKLRDLYTELLR